MAKGLVSDTNLTAIANAIRSKNGSSDTYTPATMAQAISDIPTSQVDQESALQWMLNNKTDYIGVAAGLTTLTELPTFTQTGGQKSLYRAFYNCRSLTSLTGLDTSNTTIASLEGAFYYCQSLSSGPAVINTGYSTISCREAFRDCRALTSIPLFKSSTVPTPRAALTDVNDATYMFYNCRSLTDIDLWLRDYGGTNNSTTMKSLEYTFNGCSSLRTVILRSYNFGGITSFSSTFAGCSSLTSIQFIEKYGRIPQTNTTADSTFRGCSNLENIPDFVLDVIIVSGTTKSLRNFAYQSGLRSINLASRTSAVTSFSGTFNGCTNLTDVGTMDMSSATSGTALQNMFNQCELLSETSLNNILASILTAGTTTNKTLKYIGLSSTQATTCTTLSNWAACQAAGWTTGY